MTKLAARLAALSLGVALLVASCTGPEAKHAQVVDEIGHLGEHSWAGVYRTASAWPLVLTMAPRTGFTLYSNSFCGNCAHYVAAGRVLASPGSDLKLCADLESREDRQHDRYQIDGFLHLVTWGDLQFAVPESNMEMFCAAVCGGSSFPDVPFRFLGKHSQFDYDNTARPAGRPQVPSRYARLIPDQPIHCRVVALVEWRRRPEFDSGDRQTFDAVYSVDVGSHDGLEVGMRLFVDGVQRWSRYNGRVEQVDRSEGRFQMLAREDEREWALGLVGRSATTLRPVVEAR
jgi:hypothetical protein